jgi:hypothetical protein
MDFPIFFGSERSAYILDVKIRCNGKSILSETLYRQVAFKSEFRAMTGPIRRQRLWTFP